MDILEMKVILIICTAALVISKSTDEILSPILVGNEAKPKQFPYQVYLTLFKTYGVRHCGGVLLSNLWVVTAAHCIIEVNNADVYLGITDIYQPLHRGQQKVSVTRQNIIVHENYVPKQEIHDICLIKFPRRVQLNELVKPARLPPRNGNNYAWKKAFASGWGATTPNEIYQNKLLWTVVSIMPNSECKGIYTIFGENELCTKSVNGKTACKGDSGGPLVSTDGSYTLIGIVSRGGRTCKTTRAVIYTRVTSYMDWIKRKTGGQLGS